MFDDHCHITTEYVSLQHDPCHYFSDDSNRRVRICSRLYADRLCAPDIIADSIHVVGDLLFSRRSVSDFVREAGFIL